MVRVVVVVVVVAAVVVVVAAAAAAVVVAVLSNDDDDAAAVAAAAADVIMMVVMVVMMMMMMSVLHLHSVTDASYNPPKLCVCCLPCCCHGCACRYIVLGPTSSRILHPAVRTPAPPSKACAAHIAYSPFPWSLNAAASSHRQ